MMSSGKKNTKPSGEKDKAAAVVSKAPAKRAAGGKSRLPEIFLVVFVAYTIFALVFAVYGLGSGISFPAAGIFVLLEACLAALLFPIPLWIHGLIFLAQLIAGLGFHMLPFMILMDILYCLGVAVIFFWTRKERAF